MNNLIAHSEFECCGCSACVDVCPCNAISMQSNNFGTLFAVLDSNKCVSCGKCHKVCPINTSSVVSKSLAYFAAKTNCTDVLTSSSGGLFAAFAKRIIEAGGVVYGAVYQTNDNCITVTHIRADSLEKIESMKGSKYVQSSMTGVYMQIRKDIREGRRVLFCGTPCQCQAVKNFINDEIYNSKLITVDIVCHGVPNQVLFSSFIKSLENKYNCRINSFNFRDKQKGWGAACSFTFANKGMPSKKYLYPSELSYYSLFENCLIMRESCYNCKFATSSRVGDLTIGDYWGIAKMQPELVIGNNSIFNLHEGVSLLFINSNSGLEFIQECDNYITKEESNLESLTYLNPQLSHPTKCDDVLAKEYRDAFINNGYNYLDIYWKKKNRLYRLSRFFINRIPNSLKRNIKSLIK